MIKDTDINRVRDICPFHVNVSTVETSEKHWNQTRVEIFKSDKNLIQHKIGEYIRNYHIHSMARDTFKPFRKNGKWYALYSANYTAPRIMDLDTGEDIGGMENDSGAMCAVEFYIPTYFCYNEFSIINNRKEHWIFPNNPGDDLEEQLDDFRTSENAYTWGYYPFAFMSGCIWGDDGSYNVELLDLREADKGIIKLDNRLNYMDLPRSYWSSDKIKLKDMIWMNDDMELEYGQEENDLYYTRYDIATNKTFWVMRKDEQKTE